MPRRTFLRAATAAALLTNPKIVSAESRADSRVLIDAIAGAAEPLRALDDPAFGRAFDRFGGSRVVLLGEETHGSSEFYRARAAITRHLIEHHGFTVVAVEADWPDAAHVNAFIRSGAKPESPPKPFRRFPTWMWRNREVQELVDWLRDHNGAVREPLRKVGFYGLDLYSLAASMDAVIDFLEKRGSPALSTIREKYACLAPFKDDPGAYGGGFLGSRGDSCEDEIAAALALVAEQGRGADPEGSLDALQNARVVASAERYYRTAGSANSWNLRDGHMFETLLSVLEERGPDSKAVVWAHNSHVGDAAATEMSRRGEFNIGELCRRHFGDRASLIGFGTDNGSVMAASNWDAQPEVKRVRPSLPESYGALFREVGESAFLLDLRPGVHESLRQALKPSRLQRAIGVVYRPETERASHYFDASLSEQFDAFVFFEETKAVSPVTGRTQPGPARDHPFAE
jgi:erythromycin esterase-like protein